MYKTENITHITIHVKGLSTSNTYRHVAGDSDVAMMSKVEEKDVQCNINGREKILKSAF